MWWAESKIINADSKVTWLRNRRNRSICSAFCKLLYGCSKCDLYLLYVLKEIKACMIQSDSTGLTQTMIQPNSAELTKLWDCTGC